MSRVLVLLPLLLTACTDREVPLRLHTPGMCTDADAGPGFCPLQNVSSILTTLQRADGTTAVERCTRVEESLCDYEDLEGYLFIRSVPPSDGIEIRIEGFREPACVRPSLFRCDSFGDNVVDLRRDPLVVPMWCDCPRNLGP